MLVWAKEIVQFFYLQEVSGCSWTNPDVLVLSNANDEPIGCLFYSFFFSQTIIIQWTAGEKRKPVLFSGLKNFDTCCAPSVHQAQNVVQESFSFCSNHSVRKMSGNLVLNLILASWKVISIFWKGTNWILLIIF